MKNHIIKECKNCPTMLTFDDYNELRNLRRSDKCYDM